MVKIKMSHTAMPAYQKLIKYIRLRRRQTLLAAVVALFGFIGLALISSSSAATHATAVEAEAGARSGNIGAGITAGASGGASVAFGNGSTTPGPGPAPDPATGTQPAISRDGVKLMRAGKQWKFAGLNADKWFGCWGGAQVPSDAQLDKYFREINPNTVTRIWPYGGTNSIAMMDKIVAAAEKYGQYLAPAMFDGNSSQCGTMPINKGNPQANINHMETFVKRYAKGTGARATNAIAFWEASNEACGDDSIQWFQAMANAFKQFDPATLVGTGSMPRYCYSGQGSYEAAHAGKVDLISIHEYDNGYSHWSGPAIEAAKKLNKPWYSGESGLCCGGGDTGNASSNATKAKSEMDQYVNQAESAGMLYWSSRLTPNAGDMDSVGGGPMWDMIRNYRHQWQGL